MLLIALFILAISLVTPSMAESTEYEMLKFLPSEIHGWKAHGKAKIYDRETIYDYMDGAGEIYLTYEFKRLIVKRYTRASGPEIIVEIFDMGSPEDAFGYLAMARGEKLKVQVLGKIQNIRVAFSVSGKIDFLYVSAQNEKRYKQKSQYWLWAG